MNKKLLGLLGTIGALVFPVLVLAAFNTVTFIQNTDIPLSDGNGSIILIVTSTSNIASTTIGTGSLDIGLESGSEITLMTASKRVLLVSPAIATFTCGATTSTVTLTSASTQNVTITLGDYCIRSFSATSFFQAAVPTIPLSWSGSSSVYYVTTTLASTGATVSSATTSAQTYNVTAGLNCGFTYVVYVHGQTGALSSNLVSASVQTYLCPGQSVLPQASSGGGGASPALATPTPVTTTTVPVPTTTTTLTPTSPIPPAPLATPAVTTPFGTKPASCPAILPGDMIKVVGKAPIYVVNKAFQTLYFPSGNEFKSWNMDDKYGGYTSISQTCFDDLKLPVMFPLAVNFRPGSFVVKKATSPQLYVVLPGNSLAKITASAARALYGATYRPVVVSSLFWPSYVKSGADITASKPHEGMLVSNGGKKWYVDAGLVLREVTTSGMSANRFKQAFVHPATDAMISGFTKGGVITALEAKFASRISD
ncbi:MAG: hypothetical protein Q7K39_00570 [Candidatus Magasanikbacteria bacterium]|nr:hypothetical protein [Candidatus Magasanikbacteria bacterium]